MSALDAIAYVGNVINAIAWAAIIAACAIGIWLTARAVIRARFTVKEVRPSSEDR